MYEGMGEERQSVSDNQRKRGMIRLHPMLSFRERQRLYQAWNNWGIEPEQQQQWLEEINDAISKALKECDNDVP